jgi:hypothetical protein
LWPIGRRPADLLPEHAFTTGRLQLGELAGKVLGVGLYAGVAENHDRFCKRLMQQKSAIGSAG